MVKWKTLQKGYSMKKLIDKILIEWSYRVHNGIPDLKNSLHIVHLRETLQDLKLPKEFITEYMQLLLEDDNEEAILLREALKLYKNT